MGPGVTVSFFPRPNLPPGCGGGGGWRKKRTGWFLPRGEEMDRLVSPPAPPPPPPKPLPQSVSYPFEIFSEAGSIDYICVKYGGESNGLFYYYCYYYYYYYAEKCPRGWVGCEGKKPTSQFLPHPSRFLCSNDKIF